ncbi:MAG: hypothetical protein ACYTGG_02435 [Planctomycetota bacterium]|jgi:hypothetical protein
MRLTRALLIVMCLGLLVAIGVPLAGLVLPLWVPSVELTAVAAWLSIMFGVGLYPCAMAFERGRHRAWMVTGLAAGVLAYGAWVRAIFLVPTVTRDEWAFLLMLGTPPTGYAVFMSFAAALALLRTPPGWVRPVRRATIVCGAACAAFIVASICYYPIVDEAWSWREQQIYTEMTARGGGVLAILSGAGLVAVLIGSISPRLGEESMPASQRLTLAITCPRCGTRQRIVTDGDSCHDCGLRIKVTPT